MSNELHETCKRCGRVLKSEVSQSRGYGKTCAEKVNYGKEMDLTKLLEGEAEHVGD
ncbi:DUF6011 domain-containing protein [Shouchella clausii]|jgi:hypothetical protein|uniref:DUF6011 domain-containing protein n=1 Tax=Shouchella clausii TaxID=79880 RepID=UPI0034A4DCB2